MAVFDFVVVINEFFCNFGLEIVIDLSCFACDNVGWSESVFADLVDSVVMVARCSFCSFC